MRKMKLFVISVLTVLTVSLFTGCTNEKEAENKSESAKKEQNSNNNGDEQSEDENADLSAMFQSLDTVDIKGEKVTSDIFADKKLTLVNIWATWCGPCVGEIPDLEELSKEYESKGVGVKGLLVQVDMASGELVEGLTDDERATAEGILKDTKVTYQQILVSKKMKEKLGLIQGFPTSYFIDKDGKVVGEPLVGANSKEDWKEIISERLDMLEEQ